jgi:hypothetical protein
MPAAATGSGPPPQRPVRRRTLTTTGREVLTESRILPTRIGKFVDGTTSAIFRLSVSVPVRGKMEPNGSRRLEGEFGAVEVEPAALGEAFDSSGELKHYIMIEY